MIDPKTFEGMEKVAPGIYIEDVKDGPVKIHVNPEEICAHLKIPLTPANIRIVEEQAVEVTNELIPGVEHETVNH